MYDSTKKGRTQLYFFKQKTAYEIPKRDWSSDVCSSDLLRLAAKACGADPRPGRQITQTEGSVAHQHIAWIFSLGYGRNHQAARQLRRQILHRVNCNIDFVSQQRVFDFFGEHSLALKDLHGSFRKPIATRPDDPDLHARLWTALFDSALHPVCLGQSQHAAARPNPNRWGC